MKEAEDHSNRANSLISGKSHGKQVHLDALPVNHDEDALLEERHEQKQDITWSDNSADGSLKRHINNIYPWQV